MVAYSAAAGRKPADVGSVVRSARAFSLIISQADPL